MIINVSNKKYWSHFTSSHHPYISEWFIKLVRQKAEKIVLLMSESDKSIGLVAGIKDNMVYSPFSAPFGGFHYSHEHLLYDTTYNFLCKLKDYVIHNNLSGINITLPPDIYQTNMNAKFTHAFIKSGYKMKTPNILNWIDLYSFDGKWAYNKVSNRCKKAIINGLSIQIATDYIDKKNIYELIKRNRIEQNREIHMSLEDLIAINSQIPVDFFQIKESDNTIIGAGIFYRGNDKIVQAIFVGDDINKRDKGTIDFLYMNIYNHYKNMDYKYIDFGTSSLDGELNIGLLRFKEIHNCETSLQYSFTWSQ